MIFDEFSNQYRYRYMDTNTDISVSVKSIDLSLVVTTRIAANNCLQPASENGQQIVKKKCWKLCKISDHKYTNVYFDRMLLSKWGKK